MIIKKNQVGLSALDYATMANNPKIAAFLANILYIFGQDVLGKDSEGNTILHMMARKVRNKDQCLRAQPDLAYELNVRTGPDIQIFWTSPAGPD